MPLLAAPPPATPRLAAPPPATPPLAAPPPVTPANLTWQARCMGPTMSGAAGAGGAAAVRANVNVSPLGGWETQEGDPEVLVRALGVEAVEQRADDGDRRGLTPTSHLPSPASTSHAPNPTDARRRETTRYLASRCCGKGRGAQNHGWHAWVHHRGLPSSTSQLNVNTFGDKLGGGGFRLQMRACINSIDES